MDYQTITPKLCRYLAHIVVLFSILQTNAQSLEQRNVIRSATNQKYLQSLSKSFEKEDEIKKSRIFQMARNSGLARIEKTEDGNYASLQDIGIDGTPLYYTTHMDPTSKVSRANALHKGGAMDLDLNGNGLEVGVWDGGVALTSHQEFDTRVSNADASPEISSHATLVTGTLISSGIEKKAKGVVYGAHAKTYDWSRDKVEAAEAAANGMLLSNHSYGIKTEYVPDWYFGSYIKVSQDWDDIMFNAPYYLMVTAAGNAQNSRDNESPISGKSEDGFDLLLGFALSKNGLTVAGANTKIDDSDNLTDVSVANYSSFGPADDGRIKPDLAGDGTSVFSTTSYTTSSYGSSKGTSMATPGVSGSLLLLQQYHEQLYGSYMKAATLKGLALHTADDVDEKGPDYKMGWGVLNSKKAAETIKQEGYSTLISEESLSHGETYSIKVIADGNGPLTASISWTDPKGEFVNRGNLNDMTAALTNDLDIRIKKNGRTYLPWKLNPAKANDKATQGDNIVDPFERIDISDAKGEYIIVIKHKGALVNEKQDFSLIVSGVAMTSCNIETPTGLEITSSTDSETTFSWNFLDDTLYEVQCREVGTSNWITEHTWEDSWNMAELQLGKKYEVRMRAVCTESMYSDFSDPVEFVFQAEDTELVVNKPYSATDELSISLYPNPAVNEISVGANVSDDAVYSILSSSGNVIKKGGLKGSVNVSDLSAGLYVMMVEDYSGVKSSKFYKK